MSESTKPWYASKTIHGIVLAVIGVVAIVAGAAEVGTALAFAGLGYAGVGRAKADKPLSRSRKSKVGKSTTVLLVLCALGLSLGACVARQVTGERADIDVYRAPGSCRIVIAVDGDVASEIKVVRCGASLQEDK